MRNLKPYVVGRWKGIKDENGLLYDFSGNGNHGTITNALMVDGKFGQAMRFDGTDDQVLVADNSAIQNVFDGGGSVSCWIKPNSEGEGNFGQIAHKISWTLNTSAELNGMVKVKLYYEFDGGANGAWMTTNRVIPLRSYTHFVVVYNSDSVSNNAILYVNGSAVSVANYTPIGSRVSDVGSALYIGDNSVSDRCFDGDIEGLTFYNTALTAGEALTLSKQTPRSLIVTPSTKMKRCFEFDGADDYLSHVDDDALDVGTGDAIWSVWVKTSATGIANNPIMSKNPDNVIWWKLGYNATDHITGQFDDNSIKATITSTGTYTDGNWHHVLITRSSTYYSLYIDNIIDATPAANNGDLNNAGVFQIGAETLFGDYFTGKVAYPHLFYFGEDGLPTGDDLTKLKTDLFNDPAGTLTSYGLSGYEDAVYTDRHDGAGSVTSLIVGKVYEFTQGTNGHDLDYGGGTLTSTGVFTATQTTGTISSGDGSDHVRRTGERANWHLDGSNSFKAPDETSNALDLTQTDTTKQPSVVYDLDIKKQFDPIFYDPLSDEKLSNRWLVKSGAFEPVYDSSELSYGIKCTTAGVIGIPVPEQMQDLTKQNLEWTWDMYKGAAGNHTFAFVIASVISTHLDSAQNGYAYYINTSQKVHFMERVNGALGDYASSDNNYVSYGVWYNYKVIRSAPGVFYFYINDILVLVTTGTNPMTDITTINTKYLVFEMDAGDMVADPKAVRY